MNMHRDTLIVITGPTASGKSALAVDLAQRLGTEIISADSRQIYKDIPIVTAVPTHEERKGVEHHLIEILPLEAYYSASEFERDALDIARRLMREKGIAIACGGSMMYVDALCNGIDELPTVPREIREQLMTEWQSKGNEWLLQQLKGLDPLHYDRVDRKNMKRVFHAVEVSLAAGRPYSSLLTGRSAEREFDIMKVYLDGPREQLFERINRRVEEMIDRGLEDEAREMYPRRHLNSLNTVGLKEMFAMFEGRLGPEEAIARIQKNTRVYAKKQITWYKRDADLLRLDFTAPAGENVERIISQIS